MEEKNKDLKESIENKDLIIDSLKDKNDKLQKELENYSFEMIQTTKKGYKIYRLDPYFKETKIEELQDFRDNINNKTIKQIIQEVIFCLDNEEIPEIVLINKEKYLEVEKYFDKILQNDIDKRLHLPEINLTIYICDDLNKIIVK